MLLQRCIEREGRLSAARGLGIAVATLMLAACASPGPKPVKAEAEAEPAAPEFGSEVPPEVQAMYEQAVAIMAAGDFVEAELRFKEFLLRHRGYPGAHVNLAIIYRENGNDERAMTAIDAALAIDPNNPVALNQKGLLLRKNGKFLEAEAAYLKAVTARPDYALAHYNLGVLNELYLQRLDAALQHFEIYQDLVGGDEQVGKWITDLRRRVAANQRTANVAE